MSDKENFLPDEENFVDIDDDLLISIVQANPCLYAKSNKDFKDIKLKEMKWQMIAETLNCTDSQVKKRWDSLRNQFSRKLRQLKNQPSGSGTSSEWSLMSCMSFLTPHIQNRKTRSLSRSTETSSRCSFKSPEHTNTHTPSSSTSYAQYSISSECSTLNDENLLSDQECLSNSTENTIESELCGSITEENKKNSETPKTHKKRMLMPPLDNFAKKKKAANDRLEDLLNKLSQAVTDLVTAYKSGKVEEQKENADPNATVIAQALNSVLPENQLSCLIAVLQLIESFKRY